MREQRSRKTSHRLTILLSLTACAVLAAVAVTTLDFEIHFKESVAAETDGSAGYSPTGTVPDPGIYYPGTEALAPNEMRVVALGTGQPSPRPKQAAACWLVELGNGDKFLFDIGAGCHERLAAQKIPYDFIDKVFIGHLHVDHFGDLASFWLGGTTMNRLTPLRIWGPSGHTPEYGTARAMELMQQMYVWGIGTRAGFIDGRGMELEVNEFPFDSVNEPIYQENGVTIRSIPPIHALDGAISYILEWNGLKLAYSSDTYPNKWWAEHTQGADIAIHECFLSPTRPRLAVGYHFFNDYDTNPEMMARVRRTYDGPLALAEDYMVFNVTKDDIRVRMSAVDEEIWPSPAMREKQPPDLAKAIPMSDFTVSGAVAMPEVVKDIYDEINEIYGTDLEPDIK